MDKELKSGTTLLAKGPTRITLLDGEIEVFGKRIVAGKEKSDAKVDYDQDEGVLIIPSANLYPIYALKDSKLEIYTNSEDNLTVIEENSIPEEWIKIKDEILQQIKAKKGPPLKIMVLGISSGKTTLIKFLANCFLRENLQGGYLDSDLGQQIIYLPTTLNIGQIKGSVISSLDIETEDTVFIGATFPKGVCKFIVSHSSNELLERYVSKHTDTNFILIDSDGWIKTEAGIVYKNFFIKTVDPDVLIIFEDPAVEELQIIEETAADSRKDRKIYKIQEINKYFYEKNKDERRFLRQSQFAKILEDYRKITIPIKNIKFIKTDYDIESNEITERDINISELVRLPYHYVIIALMTEDSELIKVGLLFSINLEKDYILFFSDISYTDQVKIKKVLLGSLRLSTKGNHQGYLYT